MQTDLVRKVMDQRLVDLLAGWRDAFYPREQIDDPLERFAAHRDQLLLIDLDNGQNRYAHYGRTFARHFGMDLTGQVIDRLPDEILPAEQRGMLAFEYAYARQVQRPLWRSYTARFASGARETWQRLVLPLGGGRLMVGAYSAVVPYEVWQAAESEPDVALLRLVIERVPVVIDAEGAVQDLALSLEAFSDTQQHVAELEEWATRDTLTGVANLRHFHHLAALELDHACRMGRAFSILALDIDHFKKINDSWGHATGDEALKAFAQACRKALRQPDILGRIGGEEFAVALPNSRVEEARMIAERLRRNVEEIALPRADGGQLSFTVSIGVATASPPFRVSPALPFPTVRSLLAEADAALYRSKANGRNCVSFASDEDRQQVAAMPPSRHPA